MVARSVVRSMFILFLGYVLCCHFEVLLGETEGDKVPQGEAEREEVLQGEAGGEQVPQGESEGDKVPQGEAEGAATKANKVLVGEEATNL